MAKILSSETRRERKQFKHELIEHLKELIKKQELGKKDQRLLTGILTKNIQNIDLEIKKKNKSNEISLLRQKHAVPKLSRNRVSPSLRLDEMTN